MSVTVQQAWSPANIERDNQNTNNASASVYFIAFDAANEAEALSAVENSAPDSFDGIPRKSVSVSDRLTETDWKIEVRYAFPSGGSGGGSAVADRDPSFSFDVSQGATRHITTPLAHKTKIPSSAPDSSAINDGEGIDIDASVCTFSETWWFPPNKITPAWKIKVASLYKKINSKKFRGFEPGDVRFEGCTGSRSGNSSSDYWQMTFKFAVQMNNKKTSSDRRPRIRRQTRMGSPLDPVRGGHRNRQRRKNVHRQKTRRRLRRSDFRGSRLPGVGDLIMQKFTVGTPVRDVITARNMNEIADAVNWVNTQSARTPASAAIPARNDVVRVHSSIAFRKYSVVSLSDSLVTHPANCSDPIPTVTAYQFSGDDPFAVTLAILQEPANPGEQLYNSNFLHFI